MKNKSMSILCFLMFAFCQLNCASAGEKGNELITVKEVLPQHKEEVSAIYKSCLRSQHGAMLQCIQNEVQKLEKDVKILADSPRMAVWEPSEEYMDLENPVPQTEAAIARGKEIFQKYCTTCHGTDGRGQGGEMTSGMPVADLSNPKLNERIDGELFWKITEGGWPMPSFYEGDVLSEKDIWMLIHFLRTLSGKE